MAMFFLMLLAQSYTRRVAPPYGFPYSAPALDRWLLHCTSYKSRPRSRGLVPAPLSFVQKMVVNRSKGLLSVIVEAKLHRNKVHFGSSVQRHEDHKQLEQTKSTQRARPGTKQYSMMTLPIYP